MSLSACCWIDEGTFHCRMWQEVFPPHLCCYELHWVRFINLFVPGVFLCGEQRLALHCWYSVTTHVLICADYWPQFRAGRLITSLTFLSAHVSNRPCSEWGELCPGSGQVWQQLHQPGQSWSGNGLCQVLLPHQGAVCPAEEPGESWTSTLTVSLNPTNRNVSGRAGHVQEGSSPKRLFVLSSLLWLV